MTVLVALAIVAAACGGSSAAPTAPSTITAPPTSEAPPTTLPGVATTTTTTVAPVTTAPPPTTAGPTTTTTAPSATVLDSPFDQSQIVAAFGLSGPTTPLGADGADGSGCSPGAEVLPDGYWFGELVVVNSGFVRIDLMCRYTSDDARARYTPNWSNGSHTLRNQVFELRDVPMSKEAVVWTNTGDGQWRGFPADTPADPEQIGWIAVLGGQVIEVLGAGLGWPSFYGYSPTEVLPTWDDTAAGQIAARWGAGGPNRPFGDWDAFGSGCDVATEMLPDGVWHVTVEAITDVLVLLQVNCYYGDDWDKRYELGDPLCTLADGQVACELDDYAVAPGPRTTAFYAGDITWYFYLPGPGYTLEQVLTGVPDDIDDWLGNPFGAAERRPGWVLVEDGEVVEWMDASGRYA